MAESGPDSKYVWLQSYSSFLSFTASPQETGHTLKALIRDCNKLMVMTGSKYQCGQHHGIACPSEGWCWGSWEASCSRQGSQWHQQAWPSVRGIEKSRSQQAGKTKVSLTQRALQWTWLVQGLSNVVTAHSGNLFCFVLCEQWHSLLPLYKRICK